MYWYLSSTAKQSRKLAKVSIDIYIHKPRCRFLDNGKRSVRKVIHIIKHSNVGAFNKTFDKT